VSRTAALILLALIGACDPAFRITLGTNEQCMGFDAAACVPCGRTRCAPGSFCCDPTCGICSLPEEGGCPDRDAGNGTLVCHDAGRCGADPVSLSGTPACERWVWNGVDCVQVFGCTCAGDCSVPQPTYTQCMTTHAACWSPRCSLTSLCPNGYFCEREHCADDIGTCTPIPSSCIGEPHAPICGCDLATYRSLCDARRATVVGTLPAPTCGACNFPAITVSPGCTTSLGWAWDGASCVEQVGCSCSGQCDRLEPTLGECLSHYDVACRDYYPCGGWSCARHSEYCSHSPSSTYCIGAPGPCTSTFNCSCILANTIPGATCSEDGTGAIDVTTP